MQHLVKTGNMYKIHFVYLYYTVRNLEILLGKTGNLSIS